MQTIPIFPLPVQSLHRDHGPLVKQPGEEEKQRWPHRVVMHNLVVTDFLGIWAGYDQPNWRCMPSVRVREAYFVSATLRFSCSVNALSECIVEKSGPQRSN